MFTGIIETIGTVKQIEKAQSNINIMIESNFTAELKIYQSIAHNGVCLTVVSIEGNLYTVTAIKETLLKSNLGSIVVGQQINLERAMKLGDRLDGHIVQGHVDQTAICTDINNAKGSWVFTFSYDKALNNITIEKGSITVNGVSLTVVNSKSNSFSVAIIPFTYEHTIFKHLKLNDVVNLEFDVVGKYVNKLFQLNQ